jgi:small subunit ribosomal protein S6
LREYEFTFVVQPEITEEGLEGLRQKLEGALERSGATRLFYEDWGRRRLAYEIQRFQKGHYLVLHYLDEGQAVPELERAARLDDSVLRFLTVLANDDVTDVDARKAEGVTLEEERKQRAAERATRDAEDVAARAAEAAEAEEAAARAAKAREEEAAAEAAEAKEKEAAEAKEGEEATADTGEAKEGEEAAADTGEAKEAEEVAADTGGAKEVEETAAKAPAKADDAAGDTAEAQADDASEAKQPA